MLEHRVSRLEQDMTEVKGTLGRLEPLVVRIDEQLRSTLPHLATREELADLRATIRGLPMATKDEFADLRATVRGLPTRGFVIGTVIGMFALVIASFAAAPSLYRGVADLIEPVAEAAD